MNREGLENLTLAGRIKVNGDREKDPITFLRSLYSRKGTVRNKKIRLVGSYKYLRDMFVYALKG